MFSSLSSANTKTVLVFMISILIGNARSKSKNDSTIISQGNDTIDNRRSHLLYEVRLPSEDAQKFLRLSEKQKKSLLSVNKTLDIQVPETFLTLKAFEHALIKRVSEYRVMNSLKTEKTKSTKPVAVRAKKIKRQKVANIKRVSSKKSNKIKRNGKGKNVKRLKNSKEPSRTLELFNRNVNKEKLTKEYDNHRGNRSVQRVKKRKPKRKPKNGKGKTATENKPEKNLTLRVPKSRSKHTKKTNKSNKPVNLADINIAKRIRKPSLQSDKKGTERKFKSIYSGRSHSTEKPKTTDINQSIIEPKLFVRKNTLAYVSTAEAKDFVQVSTINKVAMSFKESTITGAKETTNAAAAKEITTEEKSTLAEEGRTITDSVVTKTKPDEESTTVEETTAVTESAPAEDTSTVEVSTPIVRISTGQDSTPGEVSIRGEDSTPGEESTLGEETTPAEETTTEETTIEKTTKVRTTLHLPLSRPLVFMGPKEDKQ